MQPVPRKCGQCPFPTFFLLTAVWLCVLLWKYLSCESLPFCIFTSSLRLGFNLSLNLLPSSYPHLFLFVCELKSLCTLQFYLPRDLSCLLTASIFIRIVIFVCALVTRSIHSKWSALNYLYSSPSDF